MKNVRIGLHIKPGVNSGSSDADISDINIVGNGKADSVGMLVFLRDMRVSEKLLHKTARQHLPYQQGSAID